MLLAYAIRRRLCEKLATTLHHILLPSTVRYVYTVRLTGSYHVRFQLSEIVRARIYSFYVASGAARQWLHIQTYKWHSRD